MKSIIESFMLSMSIFCGLGFITAEEARTQLVLLFGVFFFSWIYTSILNENRGSK